MDRVKNVLYDNVSLILYNEYPQVYVTVAVIQDIFDAVRTGRRL